MANTAGDGDAAPSDFATEVIPGSVTTSKFRRYDLGSGVTRFRVYRVQVLDLGFRVECFGLGVWGLVFGV
jgi:hypothetical protein